MSGSGASVFLEVVDEKTAVDICNQKPKVFRDLLQKG